MENTNKNIASMTNIAIIGKIGAFIKNERLNSNKTQGQLADIAGVNRSTVSQIENGEAITLLSLIQIIRALNKLELLEIFSPQQLISPIALAKKDLQKRQRARNSDNNNSAKSDW